MQLFFLQEKQEGMAFHIFVFPNFVCTLKIKAMPRIKEGFKGERIVVLPGFLIEELKRDPLGRELYITDIGYYPHAGFHYCERKEEDSNEFVLIYCVEGEGWFETGR